MIGYLRLILETMILLMNLILLLHVEILLQTIKVADCGDIQAVEVFISSSFRKILCSDNLPIQ